MTRVIADIESFRALVGQDLGTSEWHEVTQLHIDASARATEDYENLHIDPAYAATTVFGGTIAHGLYTLSLGPKFYAQILVLEKFRAGLVYGYDKVRFTSPVKPRSRPRMTAHLERVDPIADGGL